jgi:tRNA nucleotidyltransferase (CCA-adding enzyme)
VSDIRFLRVGGIVRDRILGVKSKDEDFVVMGCRSFEDMIDAVISRGGRIFEGTERPEFGVVRGLLPEIGAADFALPRDDGFSSDGRRPDSVTIHDDLIRDLARRDFTVNAMAEDEDGNLIDPFGGRDDLALKVLRFVGDAKDRLAEDRLRAFRGVRFEVTKGLMMTFDTTQAIAALRSEDFEAVSTERIREELLRAFAHNTKTALIVLTRFPNLLDLALERGVWLEPTTRKAN